MASSAAGAAIVAAAAAGRGPAAAAAAAAAARRALASRAAAARLPRLACLRRRGGDGAPRTPPSPAAAAGSRSLTVGCRPAGPSSPRPRGPPPPASPGDSGGGGIGRCQQRRWQQRRAASSSGPCASDSSQYGAGGSGGGGGGDGGAWPFWAAVAGRAAAAAGLVHVWTEAAADATLCEGPSMSPTIRPSGEVVLVDKWHPRRLGLRDGDQGQARAALARARQAEFERAHKDAASSSSPAACCWHEPVLPSVSELQEGWPWRQRSSVAAFWSAAWAHMRSPVSVGDVLVVRHPGRDGTVCKRVVALPGDEVLLGGGGHGGRHFAPSSPPPPGRHNRQHQHQRQLVVVPDGHVWLEGDNPSNSSDSRHYGPVPASLIVGRVLCRVWPLRGQAWMVRGRRPVAQSEPYGAAPGGTVVLPAGYDGQPMLRRDVHESLRR
jgi:inner membrane protease subunit 1